MPEKDIMLSVQEIEPGGAVHLRERFGRQEDRKEELEAQLREEGITAESVFIFELNGTEYLLYYIEADDIHAALETWRESESEATAEYKQLLEETLVGGLDAYHLERGDLIFHIDVGAE